MNKSINMSSIENLNINDVLKEHSRAMFGGALDEILLSSKGSIKLKLQVIHQSEYMNFIIINLYDCESEKGFQYAHPIVEEYEDTNWDIVNKFYDEWKDYFNNWCDDLENELMESCGFKNKIGQLFSDS